MTSTDLQQLCLWKKVMLDPHATSSQGSDPQQKQKCQSCHGDLKCANKIHCQKFFSSSDQ